MTTTMLVSGEHLPLSDPPSGDVWPIELCPFNDTRWQPTVLDSAPGLPTVETVNDNHQQLCPSLEWASFIQDEVLPWLVEQTDLGAVLLEIGPGPGAATEWLRHRVTRLVAVELDAEAAYRLEETYADTNVKVEVGSGADLPYDVDSFDSVATLTMLHHVPTLALQRSILAEALRVLRPGGALIGSDSLGSTELHKFHAGDSYNPIDPAVLLVVLLALGFDRITVKVDGFLSFVAHKPDGIERCP